MSIVITLLALLVEATFGYPQAVLAAIGHPVTWMGRLVSLLDRKLNSGTDNPLQRKIKGFIALAVIVGGPVALAYFAELWLLELPFGFIAVAVLASSLLAQRSLHEHVARVADALEHDGLDGGRRAVSQIVGRDPDALDEAGVARAAIESLAENFSDGIVAPVFWLAVGGLPGGVAYKAINTADSMIGHRTARHKDFGFAAAKLDDLVNLPASRLSALLIVLAAMFTSNTSASGAWRAVWRDAGKHRSPNAGWPEAAMAGALRLSLAGPRIYGGSLVDDATMGDGRREATAQDIRAAVALYQRADLLLVVLIAAIALLVIALR
jgi:adenosylcobinamide-phosphate synthase